MTTQVNKPVIVAVIFIWIGFVCAISFLEAWIKFRAPGITLTLGVGIGKLVFNALNKIEWIFTCVIVISIIYKENKANIIREYLFIAPIIILLIQTLWLLPELDKRADLYISGTSMSESNLHFYYVAAELLKTFLLSLYGVQQFKNTSS